MVNLGLHFILSGSSANTFGGRLIPRTLFSFVSKEVIDFQINKAVQNGMIPRHYLVNNATDRLEGYVEAYMREEIRNEAAVQDVEAFEQFMEATTFSNGEMINYSNIASYCDVDAKTVKSYYQILKNTLMGYEMSAYAKVINQKVVQASKFYCFDVGLANYLMERCQLRRESNDYGHAFKHFIMQELIAYLSYFRHREKISYWPTDNNQEVDAFIVDAKVAIEI